MLFLMPGKEVKTVYERLVKTLKTKINWKGVFVISNNNIVLPGEERSFVLSIDNRRTFFDVAEVEVKYDEMHNMGDGKSDLSNFMNIPLYVFGKWGRLQGLTVQQDFAKLNSMFNNILKPFEIEASFNIETLKFFKEGIQFTFEDVILEMLNKKFKEDEEEEDSAENLGLWHKIRWTSGNMQFEEEEKIIDEAGSKAGLNFYSVPYKCPKCKNIISMVVFWEGREFVIDTDVQRVYLARAYTCKSCMNLFTPKPGLHLYEGDIFYIDFDGDAAAYEDYVELLGTEGGADSNYNFNRYEYQLKHKVEPEKLEQLSLSAKNMNNDQEKDLVERINNGFFPQADVKKYGTKIKKDYAARIKKEKRQKARQDFGETVLSKKIITKKQNKKDDVQPAPLADDSASETKSLPVGDDNKQKKNQTAAPGFSTKENSATNAMTLTESEATNQKSPQTQEDSSQNQSEPRESRIPDEEIEKQEYDKITYEIRRIKSQGADMDEDTKEYVKKLETAAARRGLLESQAVLKKLPKDLTREDIRKAIAKLKKYDRYFPKAGEIIKNLKEKIDDADKAMVETIKASVKGRGRDSLVELQKRLEDADIEERNKKEALLDVRDKIYKIDKKAIDEICPDIMNMSYDEGIEAYEKISGGIFLPELKDNTIIMLDKRLRSIKMNESGLLSEKLSKELIGRTAAISRIHFYNARKYAKKDSEDPEVIIVNNALANYGFIENKYEYPIAVFDSSKAGNGKSGVVLTPEHIFYKGMVNPGKIKVYDILSVESEKRLFSKEICISVNGKKEKIKLPLPFKSDEADKISSILNKYIEYLKEKPQSRKLEYIAKENHAVKCCYRCGYTFKEGNICPKCGYFQK